MTDWLLAILGSPPETPPANPELVTTDGNAELFRVIDASTIVAADAGNFVWRPGGVAAGNVYTTWATLMAAVAIVKGHRNVTIDTSLGAASATPAGTYDADDVTWEAGAGSVSVTVTFAEGVHLTAVNMAMQGVIFETAGTTNVWSPPAGAVLRMSQAALANTLNASPFLKVNGGPVSIVMDLGGVLGTATGNPIAQVEAAGTLSILACDESEVFAGAVKQGAAPGGVLSITFDGASQWLVSATQVPTPTMLGLDPQPTFVFQPGGVAGGNVFTTWASLMAAVALSPGARSIVVDDTLAAAHATAGTWDVQEVTFYSHPGATRSLIVDDGCHWTTTEFTVVGLTVSGAANTPVLTTAGTLTRIFVRSGGAIQSTTATAFVQNSNGILGIIAGPGGVMGDGVHPLVTTDVAKTTLLQLLAASTLNANASAGAGTVLIQADSSTIAIGAGNVGTVSFLDKAAQVAFTPGTPGNWQPAPTLASAALDQLAAPNFIQAAANTGTGTTTTSAVTGNIAKKRSGKVSVQGLATGTISANGTVTVSLLRDAAPILALPALTILADTSFAIPIFFYDTLPDAANHTYSVQAVADGAHTIAVGAGGNLVSADEL